MKPGIFKNAGLLHLQSGRIVTIPAMQDRRATADVLIGSGLTSDVYAYGDGRVLKLFHPGYVQGRVEHEFHIARTVHEMGVPAPAVYDLLEMNGRWGIVMERVVGLSLLRRVQSRPWTMFSAVRELSELQARINRHSAPETLPSQKDWIAQRIVATSDSTESERQVALRNLDQLPDGNALCHGDFHPENVIFTERGPVIIDWSRTTRGCPAGDAACTSLLMQHAQLPSSVPRYLHGLMALFRHRLHQSYLRAYIQTGSASQEAILAWESPLIAARIVSMTVTS